MIGPQPDTKVRMRKLRNSKLLVLFHPCAICGNPQASLGFGVDLHSKKPRYGLWADWPHAAMVEAMELAARDV